MPIVLSSGGNASPPFVSQFDITITVVRFQTPTTTGNVDWTTPDLNGKTPKAVEFVFCKADADGVARDGMNGGVGFADGSSEYATMAGVKQGGGTSISWRVFKNTQCIYISGETSAGLDVGATFTAFIPNGVRLNFNQTSTGPYFVIAKFFAGESLTASVFSATMSTQDAEIDVTGIGFEPNLVILAGGAKGGELTYGAAHSPGDSPPTITQKALLWRMPHGVGSGEPVSYLASNRCGGSLTGSTLDYGLEAANFDANGISLFARGGDSDNEEIAGLALHFGGAESWVGSLDSPTSTGDWAKTNPSFKPQIVTIGMTAAQSEDTVETDEDAGPFGIAVFDLEGNEFCAAWAEEDSDNLINGQSLTDDQAVHFTDHLGAQTFAADFSSMDANGWTLDFTLADPTTRKWFGWAVQIK